MACRMGAVLRTSVGATTTRRMMTTASRNVVRPAIICAHQQKIMMPTTRFYSSGSSLAREEVQSRIFDVIKSFDKVTDPSKITPKSTFAGDLGLDSLDTVEVVMAIEEEFNIEIPDKEADEIKSVGDAIDYILAQPDAV